MLSLKSYVHGGAAYRIYYVLLLLIGADDSSDLNELEPVSRIGKIYRKVNDIIIIKQSGSTTYIVNSIHCTAVGVNIVIIILYNPNNPINNDRRSSSAKVVGRQQCYVTDPAVDIFEKKMKQQKKKSRVHIVHAII